MIIECPNCNKKFTLDKKLIPENGRSLKCSSCDHIWHYKISITKNLENIETSEENNTKFDTSFSEIENKEREHKELTHENFTEINEGLLSKEGVKDEKVNIVDEEKIDKKDRKITMVLPYFIIVIISLLSLIFLFDTFKIYLSNIFPSMVPFFDSFYDTILYFKLFIKDLNY